MLNASTNRTIIVPTLAIIVLVFGGQGISHGQIDGPWLWMVVPTHPTAWNNISAEGDSLATASGGAITEAHVAQNGVSEGDTIGHRQWARSDIQGNPQCTKYKMRLCVDPTVCWANNINQVVSVLGMGTGANTKAHTAYALINLISPREQRNVNLRVNSGDATKVWLNGNMIHREPAESLNCGREINVFLACDPQVCISDPSDGESRESSVRVTLKTGNNLLLVKVRQHGEYWDMNVQLDADFTPAAPTTSTPVNLPPTSTQEIPITTTELDVTPPSITATSPHGVIRSESPVISVSASDDMSGVNTIEVSVTDSSDRAVQGTAQVASDKTLAIFTPSGALSSGVYSVDVQVTDMRGNTASSQWQFTIELDTIAPSILSTHPTQEHTENRRPTISATYTDNMSGVNAESVTLWVDGVVVEPDSVSDMQVVYTPQNDLDFGQHTVKLKVSDNAPRVNTADQEWVFFVERMGIANARNYPNPFEDETTIDFRVSRQASISIRIYDFTGRLVAEPVTNEIYEAGLVEIDWHGETDAGDHLARGVYFCHILMESELEPQSTILKMGIISE